MSIHIDSREKPRAISRILADFDSMQVPYFVSKLPVGDYISLDNARLAIDRKQNLNELVSNVCQQHKRFSAELQRANSLGIKLIVLVEHGRDIKTLDMFGTGSIRAWANPRWLCPRTTVQGAADHAKPI
jgi:ERCC4-type nuclease